MGELLRARGQEPQKISSRAPTTVVAAAMTITTRCLPIFVSFAWSRFKVFKEEASFWLSPNHVVGPWLKIWLKKDLAVEGDHQLSTNTTHNRRLCGDIGDNPKSNQRV